MQQHHIPIRLIPFIDANMKNNAIPENRT